MTLEQFKNDVLRKGVPFSMAKNILSQEMDIWFHDSNTMEPTSLEEMAISVDDIKTIINANHYSMVSTTDTIHGEEHTVEVYTSTVSPIWRYYNNKTEDLAKN